MLHVAQLFVNNVRIWPYKTLKYQTAFLKVKKNIDDICINKFNSGFWRDTVVLETKWCSERVYTRGEFREKDWLFH